MMKDYLHTRVIPSLHTLGKLSEMLAKLFLKCWSQDQGSGLFTAAC